jgi:hypothetical protein
MCASGPPKPVTPIRNRWGDRAQWYARREVRAGGGFGRDGGAGNRSLLDRGGLATV